MMRDLQFPLFGFPVTVQPFFWLLAVLLGASNLGPIENMPVWMANLAVLVAAVLVAVLVHELGHALTFRHLYGVPSIITVHTFGGVTVPLRQPKRSYSFAGTCGQVFLAFSGPLAGFILAAALMYVLTILPEPQQLPAELMLNLLKWTAMLSIFWGIFNLLPIYPMDGGHIAREFLTYLFPYRGVRFSLILSMTCAALLAVLALRLNTFFMVFFFAYFAYMNYQELSGRGR